MKKFRDFFIQVISSYPWPLRIVLGLIIIAGIAVRVRLAVSAQLWRDEVYIFFVAHNNSLKDLVLQNHWDTAHPPLYYIFLHFWQMISIKPLFLRLPSIILSAVILSGLPVLTYLLGGGVWFGIASEVLFALSPSIVSLTTLVRPYPLEVAMVLLSLTTFVAMERGLLKSSLPFVLTAILVIMSDYSGVWLLASYGIYWILFYVIPKHQPFRRVGGKIIGGLLLAALGLIPSILLLVKGFGQAIHLEAVLGESFASNHPIADNLWQLPAFIGTLESDPAVRLGILSFENWSLLVTQLILFGLIFFFFRQKKNGALIGILTIFPLVTAFAISVWFVPIFLARSLSIVTIGVMFALASFGDEVRRRSPYVAAALLCLLLVQSISYGYTKIAYVDPAYDWKGLNSILARSAAASPRHEVTLISHAPQFYFRPVEYYRLLNRDTYTINYAKPLVYYGNLGHTNVFFADIPGADGLTSPDSGYVNAQTQGFCRSLKHVTLSGEIEVYACR